MWLKRCVQPRAQMIVEAKSYSTCIEHGATFSFKLFAQCRLKRELTHFASNISHIKCIPTSGGRSI